MEKIEWREKWRDAQNEEIICTLCSYDTRCACWQRLCTPRDLKEDILRIAYICNCKSVSFKRGILPIVA